MRPVEAGPAQWLCLEAELPHSDGRSEITNGYSGSMDAQLTMTAEELIERVRHAGPPTPDDVTILWDRRRLDSLEAVMEWLAEAELKRAEEAAADGTT